MGAQLADRKALALWASVAWCMAAWLAPMGARAMAAWLESVGMWVAALSAVVHMLATWAPPVLAALSAAHKQAKWASPVLEQSPAATEEAALAAAACCSTPVPQVAHLQLNRCG